MNVLVAGAAGALGRVVARALVERGHSPRALAHRTPLPAELALTTHSGDALDPSQLAGACDGIDVIFSSLGASVNPSWGGGRKAFSRVDTPANRNLIEAAHAAGVQRFVYVGVAGSREWGHLDYVRAHELVAASLEESGLDYAVIRPTGLFSAFALMVPMATRGPLPLIGHGTARTNPIHNADLAELCADAIEGGQPQTEIEVGGPEVLSRKEIAELVFGALGKPARLRNLPLGVARAAALLLRPIHPRLSHLTAFYATVGTQDLIVPSSGERRLSDYLAAVAREAA